MDYEKVYKDLDGIFDLSTGWMWDDFLRQMGWWLIKGLATINNWIEDVATKVITMNGLYESSAMENFMDVIRPLVFGLFLIAVVVLGFQFMLNKIEKREEVILNILLAVSIIVVIPNLMTMMNNVLGVGLDHIGKQSLSESILKSNISDLMYYVESDFNYAEGGNYAGDENTLPQPIDKENPNIGTTDYTYANQLTNPMDISINQDLDVRRDDGWFPWTTAGWVSNLSGEQKYILEHRLIATGYGDGTRIVTMQKNTVPATSLGQESYYRWSVNWGIIMINLLITGFALAITVIKIGRAIFDLAFHQIFGMFVAVSDLTGGQRTKKILVEIMSTFAVIFIMMLLLHLFIIYANWVNGMKHEIGIIGVILMLIAGAWALIDAPDVVQRLLGIDAGLRSGWQAAMGAFAGAKIAGGGGKALASAGKGASKLAGGGLAGAVGTVKGMQGKSSGGTSGGSGSKPIPPQSGQGGQNGQQFSTGAQQGKNTPPVQNAQTKQSSGQKNVSQAPNSQKGKSPNGQQGGIGVSKSPVGGGQGLPSGYSQIASGIIAPNDAIPSMDKTGGGSNGLPSSDTGIGNVPSQGQMNTIASEGGQRSPQSSERVSPNEGFPTMPSETPKAQDNLPTGHIIPKASKHTLLGGSKMLNRTKDHLSKAHNSGFDVGQKIRKTGSSVKNTAMKAQANIANAKINQVNLGKKEKSIPTPKEGVIKRNEIRDTKRD